MEEHLPSPMTVRVRDARPEDAEELHVLLHAAYQDREDAAGSGRPLTDTIEKVRADIDEGLVLVAEDAQGRLVASVMLRRVANIRRLAVAPASKGAGLGAQMLEAAVARAQTDGFTVAMLDTIPTLTEPAGPSASSASPAAHPWLPEFYRKHGFEERCIEVFPDGKEWLQFRRRLQ